MAVAGAGIVAGTCMYGVREVCSVAGFEHYWKNLVALHRCMHL